MKKFVELIQRIHQERFSVVMNKIVSEKIPVTFLSIAPVGNAVETVKNLRAQNLNITNLITITPPPPDYFQIDFDITHLSDVGKIHPRPEFILTPEFISARIAVKFIDDSKIISLSTGKNQSSDDAYNVFMNHLTELEEVYKSFVDEKSRETFYGYWLGNISQQFGEQLWASDTHYLTTGFIPEKDAIFVEAGTYDGVTSVLFSEMGYKVYGFEIDKQIFETAKKIADEKGFVVENLGLGSFKTKDVTTLDSYVREKNLPRVDCIKMDVEGAEIDVLRGAKTTVARWKPILLLSAYHKWDDFWTLMNYVKSIRSDYEWALRQYPETPETMPVFFKDQSDEFFQSFDLEKDRRDFGECCLLAR